MLDIRSLFTSPEWYPLSIDFPGRLVSFVRMSRQSYRDTVFLDTRTQPATSETFHFKLDDLLLAAAGARAGSKRILYILHPTFACSTLLARYFELLPNCFVLKEPMILTQMAAASLWRSSEWNDMLNLVLRLLTRTYDPEEFVVIKAHEPCNALGQTLLEHNQQSTITFMNLPLRHFVLSILKSDFRRKWVRTRVPNAARAAHCQELIHIQPADVNDAQAAAYLWLVNRFLCDQLVSGTDESRVLAVDAGTLAETPEQALPKVMANCGVHLTPAQLKSLIDDPSVRHYSKDLSKPYDATSRRQEIAELEKHWGNEADSAIEWATRSSWAFTDAMTASTLHRSA